MLREVDGIGGEELRVRMGWICVTFGQTSPWNFKPTSKRGHLSLSIHKMWSIGRLCLIWFHHFSYKQYTKCVIVNKNYVFCSVCVCVSNQACVEPTSSDVSVFLDYLTPLSWVQAMCHDDRLKWINHVVFHLCFIKDLAGAVTSTSIHSEL